ncbi:ABC transporter ATP-binding protein [Microvirga antarctica]|uniref:ABC transporter ATP-binding protein n=1 Tax=Microvirga antarctica TaxID=2819233 RepID=UPI001B30416F|nr:ABC transporter ATP-binding protein [Microvirga antarctica]
MTDIEIQLENVTKTYSGGATSVTALTETSLSIAKGEFVVIVGPSGCGKTTLLRMIAGLIKPTSGEIKIRNKPLWVKNAKSTEAVGELGFVFQQANLLPWRSVAGNIALPLELRGVGRRERGKRAEELAELVGLKGFENASPHELSGGMAQRAAIARALSNQPSILLMDEPFGALDVMTRDAMNQELQQIWLDLRPTIVLVTHSIPESVFLADRVISLAPRPGRIVDIKDIHFPRPRTPETERSSEFQSHIGQLRGLLDSHSKTGKQRV